MDNCQKYNPSLKDSTVDRDSYTAPPDTILDSPNGSASNQSHKRCLVSLGGVKSS